MRISGKSGSQHQSRGRLCAQATPQAGPPPVTTAGVPSLLGVPGGDLWLAHAPARPSPALLPQTPGPAKCPMAGHGASRPPPGDGRMPEPPPRRPRAQSQRHHPQLLLLPVCAQHSPASGQSDPSRGPAPPAPPEPPVTASFSEGSACPGSWGRSPLGRDRPSLSSLGSLSGRWGAETADGQEGQCRVCGRHAVTRGHRARMWPSTDAQGGASKTGAGEDRPPGRRRAGAGSQERGLWARADSLSDKPGAPSFPSAP